MTLVSINGSNFACHAEGMWICKLGLKGEHMNMLESDLAFGIGLSLFKWYNSGVNIEHSLRRKF